MTQITKAVAGEFRKDFQEAIKSLEKKYEAKISLGGIRFNDNSITAKMELAKSGGDEGSSGLKVDAKHKNNFNKYCFYHNLTSADFGKEVKHGKEVFNLVGMTPRNKDFICQLKGTDTLYRIPARQLDLG